MSLYTFEGPKRCTSRQTWNHARKRSGRALNRARPPPGYLRELLGEGRPDAGHAEAGGAGALTGRTGARRRECGRADLNHGGQVPVGRATLHDAETGDKLDVVAADRLRGLIVLTE